MSTSTTVSKLALRLSYVIAAILVLLPFHVLLTTWIGSNIGHLDLIRIWKEIITLLLLPFVAWLIFNDFSLRKWFLRSWIVRLFGLYIILHFGLGAWALTHHQLNGSAFIYSLIINLRFVGFFLLTAVLASRTPYLVKNWKNLILWPATAVIIFGIIQVVALPQDFLRHFGYSPQTIPAYQTVDANVDYQRIQSTLRGANPLGAYLILIIPALLYIARRNRIFLAGTLLGATFVLFYTYSRSAWLGLILTLAALVALSGKIKFKKKITVTAVLLVLIIIAGLMQLTRSNQTAQDTLLHTSTSSTSLVTSNEARIAAIKAGARDVVHQPLGRGPGTAGPASFRNESQPARISENYFLQIGQEVGVIGMALIVAIIAIVAWQLWQRRDEQLARILLVSFVGLTFVNLISHAWTDDTLAYLWWGLAGVALAPRRPAQRRSR